MCIRDRFDIEGDVIPMSFIINNGDQDPAILINGFGEGYGLSLIHISCQTVLHTDASAQER